MLEYFNYKQKKWKLHDIKIFENEIILQRDHFLKDEEIDELYRKLYYLEEIDDYEIFKIKINSENIDKFLSLIFKQIDEKILIYDVRSKAYTKHNLHEDGDWESIEFRDNNDFDRVMLRLQGLSREHLELLYKEFSNISKPLIEQLYRTNVTFLKTIENYNTLVEITSDYLQQLDFAEKDNDDCDDMYYFALTNNNYTNDKIDFYTVLNDFRYELGINSINELQNIATRILELKKQQEKQFIKEIKNNKLEG